MSSSNNDKTPRTDGQHEKRHPSKSRSMPGTPYQCDFESYAVDGCKGCSELLKRVDCVRKAWRAKWTTDMGLLNERTKTDLANCEAGKQQCQNELANLRTANNQLRAELENERKKQQQIGHELSAKELQLARAKSLLEKYGAMRVEALRLTDELVGQLEQSEHNNDNTSAQLTSNGQKKYEEVAVQTGASSVEKSVAPILKQAKRLTRRRIELDETIECINEVTNDLNSRSKFDTEEGEKNMCNGEQPRKRARRTDSFPVEDPLQMTLMVQNNNSDNQSSRSSSSNDSVVNDVNEDDDDGEDIIFLGTHLQMPSTPPSPTTPVKLSASVTNTPVFGDFSRITPHQAHYTDDERQSTEEEEQVVNNGCAA